MPNLVVQLADTARTFLAKAGGDPTFTGFSGTLYEGTAVVWQYDQGEAIGCIAVPESELPELIQFLGNVIREVVPAAAKAKRSGPRDAQ
jgi:hypothetical protein